MFAAFLRRITFGYVVLAVLLILLVVAASTALAFVLYSHAINDGVAGATQRATEIAATYSAQHRPLSDAAPVIAREAGRGRYHVAVFDQSRRMLAQNERSERPSASDALLHGLGNAIGLPRVRVPVAGGTVFISADFDRFGRMLLWYWSIMLPVGVVALALAWLIGRRITARAIRPLTDVTRSLQTLAAGDPEHGNLVIPSGELQELTSAYNDVVLRLASAAAERRKTDSQMRQFVADAGHELRTPLTVVMGYLDLLRSGGLRADAAASDRAYESMLEESRRMRTLIERLILLARLDREPGVARAAIVDLNEIVRRAAQAVSPIDRPDRIGVHLSGGAAATLADESETYEAVKNLLDNAVKYAGASRIDVTVCREDSRATVVVRDEGPGMEPQDLAHAFDRFYRGASKYDVEGSGLGLAIAKRAVERAGGTIDLQSSPGSGTQITLNYPAFSEDSQKAPV